MTRGQVRQELFSARALLVQARDAGLRVQEAKRRMSSALTVYRLTFRLPLRWSDSKVVLHALRGAAGKPPGCRVDFPETLHFDGARGRNGRARGSDLGGHRRTERAASAPRGRFAAS